MQYVIWNTHMYEYNLTPPPTIFYLYNNPSSLILLHLAYLVAYTITSAVFLHHIIIFHIDNLRLALAITTLIPLLSHLLQLTHLAKWSLRPQPSSSIYIYIITHIHIHTQKHKSIPLLPPS